MAWSRSGGIAYISPNGYEVKLRYLRVNPATGQWDLSEEYDIVRQDMVSERNRFLHVEWGHTGIDLAVADDVGRIFIFNINIFSANQSTMGRLATDDPGDELGRIIGIYWFNVDRPVGLPSGFLGGFADRSDRLPLILLCKPLSWAIDGIT